MKREWLKQLRGNMTHEEMAAKLKISRSFYTELESGLRNPSVRMAKRVALELAVPWTVFFDHECRLGRQFKENLSTGTEGRR